MVGFVIVLSIFKNSCLTSEPAYLCNEGLDVRVGQFKSYTTCGYTQEQEVWAVNVSHQKERRELSYIRIYGFKNVHHLCLPYILNIYIYTIEVYYSVFTFGWYYFFYYYFLSSTSFMVYCSASYKTSQKE